MAKSLGKTAVWTACSTVFKIALGFVLVKLLAVQFGTEGLGQAANFMTLITVLGVFAGGGIFNGVTKFTAELADNEAAQRIFTSTASKIIVGFSALLAVVFVLFSAKISQWLFFDPDFRPVVIATAFCQFGIALSNYFLALLKGRRDARGNALSIIYGTAIGFLMFVLGQWLFGYVGALVGLVLMPALTFIPAWYFLRRQAGGIFNFSEKFNRLYARQLGKFSVMVFVTAITLPLGYMWLRELLVSYRGLHAVGLWQGVAKISDAYLQFITAAFSVYLLPTFAKLHEKAAIKRELSNALRFVAVAVIGVSSVVYLLREWVILLLYSADFSEMQALFGWQLAGDVCKVSAYVFGYLIVAKAALKLYIAAELLQLCLLTGSGALLIPYLGEHGAVMAYFIACAGYLAACLIGFRAYLKRG